MQSTSNNVVILNIFSCVFPITIGHTRTNNRPICNTCRNKLPFKTAFEHGTTGKTLNNATRHIVVGLGDRSCQMRHFKHTALKRKSTGPAVTFA
jgi:hypothetical protein